MTAFERLKASGLPLDWTTLLLGWGGFGDQDGFVRTDQLQSYAMDQIGYGPESEFALVSGIAFAEDRDTWTIQACMEQLASATPEARNRAERVWRWVMLTELVSDLKEELAEAILIGNTPEDDYCLEAAMINVWSDLRCFWSGRDFPAHRFATIQDWEPYAGIDDAERAATMLFEHQQFLDQEYAALREAPNAHRS